MLTKKSALVADFFFACACLPPGYSGGMSPMLAGAQRILILGSPGAGKSTLARQLARSMALPLVHLDALYWAQGTPPAAAQWRSTVEQAIAQPAWIMDGHYPSSLAQRLQRADAVIYLDFPRSLCLWRVLRRSWQGQRADGVPATSLPRWDWRFVQRVWHSPSVQRPRDMALLSAFEGPVLRFTGPSALQQCLHEAKYL